MVIAIPPVEQATEYNKTTLTNGLRVLSAYMPHTRSAAIHIYVGVGARQEAPKVSGISHFVEHMVFKGTEQRPNPVQISEAIEGVGGSLNAATDHENTNYRALVPSRYFSTAIRVLTDMLHASRFHPDDVEKERAVILEEISSTLDSPGEIADLVSDEMIWGKHALGLDVAGSVRTVKRIMRDDLVRHIDKFYNPSNIVVSIAGNVPHEEALEEVTNLWGGLAARSDATVALDTPEVQDGPRIKVYKKRTEQTNFILCAPSVAYTHPDRFTQDVLDGVLGSGMSSRLFVELRENLGLAYSVSSFVKSYSDVGVFGVHAAVDNEQVIGAVGAIIKELKRVCDEKVSETELRKVKEYIKGHTLLSLERSGHVAQWGGWQELMLNRIELVDDVLECIDAVTGEDLQDLAGRIFKPEALRLAIVGPFKEVSMFEELLTA